MAVSGRKIVDFKDSISLGSAEYFDHKCDPCLNDDQNVEAHGFCVECQEYLCKSCYKFHQKTKALKNHHLLDKDNLGKADISTAVSDVCTEKCSTHRNEVIKFFCPDHEDIGCTDCMTMHHRTCNLDYIPEKCVGVGDSSEYREVTGKLDQKMKEIEAVMKSATERDAEIGTCHDNIIKEITKFRQEINHRLDELQDKIKKDAAKVKSSEKEIIKQVVEICTRVSADIKKLQASIEDSKKDKQPGQLFIDIKRAKSKLKSDAIQKAGESLEKTSAQYTFERSKDLENSILSKEVTFGKMKILSTPSRKKRSGIKLTPKGDINIKTKSDVSFFKCCVNGCTYLSHKKLVLVDNSKNRKVKVIDTEKKSVLEEMVLDSDPFDITALTGDRIAVTLPDKREVLIMALADKLSITNRVSVEGICKGISYHKGQIYVLCRQPTSVLLLNTWGTIMKTMSLNDYMFKEPLYIAVSEDSEMIYICDKGNDVVKGISLQGDITAEFQLDKDSLPKGMTVLDDGSLLMCCLVNEKILHVSGDLKQSEELIRDIYGAQSICYNSKTDEICVGGYSCNSLKVFSLK